ncbi:MAG TPA: hypothetical protein VKY92_26070 [Verrucomicrobiae bacterium]|nr:hypothetical protein [Verrucomicrobiae bacterium]
MMDLKIELDGGRTAYAPAEKISGQVEWDTDKQPQRIELRLFWFTRGKGTEDAGVVSTMRFDQPLARDTRPFTFPLPEAPYSFSGKLISLVWALELIAYPSKDVARVEFEMGPGGREIKLESVQDRGSAQTWISITR